MAESRITLGSIIGTMVFTVVIMAILGPISIGMGVFNPALNSTTPAGQYITSVFGANGIQQYAAGDINQGFLPYASESANTSITGIKGLSASSGFAFIFGGIGEFFNALWNFPKWIYVIMIESFAYGGLQKFLPFDIAGVLSIALISYLAIILVMKLVSIFSKPGGSVENL